MEDLTFLQAVDLRDCIRNIQGVIESTCDETIFDEVLLEAFSYFFDPDNLVKPSGCSHVASLGEESDS